MKNSKKNFGIAGQSTTEAKKPHKHDANLQKNSTLYFQIGLILCLLATYGLFEMQFQDKKISLPEESITDIALNEPDTRYQLEPIKKQKPVEVVKEKPKQEDLSKLTNEIKEVDNNIDKAETKVLGEEANSNQGKSALDPGDITGIIKLEDTPKLVLYKAVQKVPIFPGCERFEDSNDKLRKCMSSKITKLVKRKFNTDIGSEYGLTGKLKVNTQFTIDKDGNVIDIKTRGSHPKLEEEAKRVINKIPKMTPGYQQDKPVGVIYTLPITFFAEN